MATVQRQLIRFGVFELDRAAGEIFRSGRKVPLQEQPLQVLLALLERPGEVVTRDELRQRLWQHDTFVDFDHGLNTAIKKVRAALGDNAETPGSSRRWRGAATGSSRLSLPAMGYTRALLQSRTLPLPTRRRDEAGAGC